MRVNDVAGSICLVLPSGGGAPGTSGARGSSHAGTGDVAGAAEAEEGAGASEAPFITMSMPGIVRCC
jgi:hypothetical protein